MSAVLPASLVLNLLPPAVSANAAGSSQAASAAPSGLHSEEILRGQKVMEITHNGFIYRLQATRLGKLILTK